MDPTYMGTYSIYCDNFKTINSTMFLTTFGNKGDIILDFSLEIT